MCFRSNPRFKVDSYVLSIALEMILKWNSSKLRPWLHTVCVYFFPPQGEYNIRLFLRLDSESESAQTGALGSHGSSCSQSVSQATSQSVCQWVSWCAWDEAQSSQRSEVSCSTAQFLISLWVREMCNTSLPARATTAGRSSDSLPQT